MLKSMTGYGRSEAAGSDVAVVVELKSVNHRFLDVQVRGPKEYLAFEAQIQGAIKAAVGRGRVEVHVRRQPLRSAVSVEPDPHLYQAYREAVDALLASEDASIDHETVVSFVLSRPGVLEVTEKGFDVMSEDDILLTALEGALEQLVASRAAEGEVLEKDLQTHLLKLLDQLDVVDGHVEGLSDRLRKKAEGRIQRMLGDRFEAWRVVQEAAVQSDKADISEEITRLKSHALQFRDALERDDPVGRRLGFLLQEMNREVNTIGSKAIEHPVSHAVVEMKAILERMREQSANVE